MYEAVDDDDTRLNRVWSLNSIANSGNTQYLCCVYEFSRDLYVGFFVGLSVSSLAEELFVVRKYFELAQDLNVESGRDGWRALTEVDLLMKGLSRSPRTYVTARLVKTVWQSYAVLDGFTAASSLGHNIREAHRMVSHWMLWSWLAGMVRFGVDGLSRFGTTKSNDWTCRLAQALYKSIQLKEEEFTASCETFLQGIDTMEITVSNTIRHDSHDEILLRVAVHMRAIISGWLGFPADDSRLHHARARFIGLVLYYSHPAILYLPSTSRAFRAIQSTFCVNARTNIIDAADMQAFESVLYRHPIRVLRSEERSLLDQIGTLYGCHSSHGELVQLSYTGKKGDGLRLLVRFLRHLSPILDAGFTPEFHLQSKVFHDQDRLSPFRESAPSRRNITHHANSPFHWNHVQTREGFFNALLFRAVTFAAPCIREDEHAWFPTLESFAAFARQHSEEPAYVCNLRAYGQQNRGRTPDSAPGLWTASDEWVNFIDSKGLIPLEEMYSFLLNLRAPQVGPLAAFLLAADYVYAEIVAEPSPKEMGSLIHKLGKGAVSGLQCLGLLPKGKQEFVERDVADAFVQAHDYVAKELSDEEKDRMGFDTVMLEHTLCKFKRLGVEGGKGLPVEEENLNM